MNEHTKGLSSALLQMKFMQRTRIRLEEEAKRKNEQKLQKRFLKKDEKKLSEEPEEVTERTVKSENRYDLLENLSFGRMSFKGFNPEVEKLMKYYKDIKDGNVLNEVDFDNGQDVTDYELATSVFGAKTKRDGKCQKMHEMDERNLVDEINEQPAKKRRNDGRQLLSGIQKKQHL
ncbi:M-phase phosphoprotein 6 family protein [Acanthocheilonema viteae]